ncbi:hypothetical protein AVEN_125491-1 [Araneus ventricosus]|uniref:Uncharacterized protein n=1 Tax=Araneus ventricosus TaxID=182803 RepID=A0A4Y2NLY2_ARAVE|nr:hypothetical protein AVEN_125491-1 [Araneus ventricosus]
MIGSSVDYVRSGGMRNVAVTKELEHLYATTAKFSFWVRNLGLTSCVLLPATSVQNFANRCRCSIMLLYKRHARMPVSPPDLNPCDFFL